MKSTISFSYLVRVALAILVLFAGGFGGGLGLAINGQPILGGIVLIGACFITAAITPRK